MIRAFGRWLCRRNLHHWSAPLFAADSPPHDPNTNARFLSYCVLQICLRQDCSLTHIRDWGQVQIR